MHLNFILQLLMVMQTKIPCFYCQNGNLYQSYQVNYLDRVGHIMHCYKCTQVFFKSVVNNNVVVEIVDEDKVQDLYRDFDCF